MMNLPDVTNRKPNRNHHHVSAADRDPLPSFSQPHSLVKSLAKSGFSAAC